MTGVARMDFHEAVRRRVLIVEGCGGAARAGLLTWLAHRHGFTVERPPRELPALDPARPYRELLRRGGRLALDSGFVGELVYGPLRRGHSRVTWIEAFDFAEAVAERGGAFLHLTAPPPALAGRPGGRDATAAAAETEAVAAAYERAFATLAQHAPVLTVRPGAAKSLASAVSWNSAHGLTQGRRIPR
ncbi:MULTISPECIES: hypothetical protein [Streptomyces]|uniref:Thymidylate kinase n=1 Tax=Streptomyces lonegramiae TaxID=3075524 RepID=A0ABU2XX04_9ACTN|nr:hypothetical protein [Streptomyces sp. DSM 41529]MDT0550035.1 hypothetical protein [Streptomyces sp. DSM 41529]